MNQGVRVIVLNSEEDYAAELRSHLLRVEGVKIVAEVDEPILFKNAIEQLPAELVLINLDSDPEALLPLAAEVAQKNPGLSIFGLSGSDKPELILEAMRSGIREFLLRPIDDKQLIEAIARVVKLKPEGAKQGKLISVVGSAGGAGATMMAVNLACELAQLSKRGVVLVDLDFTFGHVATLLDISPKYTMADLCGTLESVDNNMIEKALIQHETGVNVLARPLHLAQAQRITAGNCASVLSALTDMFEYVVCDGPLRFDSSSRAILDMADMTFIIMHLVVTWVRNTDRFIQELRSQGYNLDRLHVIINRYGKDYSTLHPEDAEQTLNRKVFWLVPNDWKFVSDSINMGQPLLTLAPKSKVRESIQNLALKIHDPKAYKQRIKGEEKSGLLAKVLGR